MGGDDADDGIALSNNAAVPEEHQIPTTDLLSGSEANIAPFRAAVKGAVDDDAAVMQQTKQRVFTDTPSAFGGGAANNDDDDDNNGDDDFESGIVSATAAATSAAAQLLAEARLKRGLEVTLIASQIDTARISTYRHSQQRADGAATSQPSASVAPSFFSPPPGHRWIGHNRNSVTCIAASPPNLVVPSALAAAAAGKRGSAGAAAAAAAFLAGDVQAATGWSSGARMLCCYGDKSGRVYAVLERASKCRIALEPAHRGGPVTCIAVSDAPPAASLSNERISIAATKLDRHIIASGCTDGTINFWSGVTLQFRGTVSMHRAAVTGIAFKAGTHTLYSVSKDAVLRVWDALETPPRHVDKLYGHTSGALCVAASQSSFLETASAARSGGATGGRAISGGDDRVPRMWKIDAATESEFNELRLDGPSGVTAGSIECMAVVGIGATHNFAFAVGTTRGTLALYDANKRNAVWRMDEAHGRDAQGDGSGLEGQLLELESMMKSAASRSMMEKNEADAAETAPVRRPGMGNPISAIAAIPGGDVVATGSGDGCVRLWRVVFDDQSGGVHKMREHQNTKVPKGLELLSEIAVPGWVNGLSFSLSEHNGKKEWSLFIATAKEQRLGRWVVLSRALNGVMQVPLNRGYTPLAMPESDEDEGDSEVRNSSSRGAAAAGAKTAGGAAAAGAKKALPRAQKAAAGGPAAVFSTGNAQQQALLKKLSASGTDLPGAPSASVSSAAMAEKRQLSDLRQKFLQTPAKRAAKKDKQQKKQEGSASPSAGQKTASSSATSTTASAVAAAAPTKKADATSDKAALLKKKKLLAAKMRSAKK